MCTFGFIIQKTTLNALTKKIKGTDNEIQYVMLNKSMLIRNIWMLCFHSYYEVH